MSLTRRRKRHTASKIVEKQFRRFKLMEEKFSEMTEEELNKVIETKMSNTDRCALIAVLASKKSKQPSIECEENVTNEAKLTSLPPTLPESNE